MAKYTELVNGKRVAIKMIYGKVINNEQPGHNLKFRLGLTPYRVAHGTTAWFPIGIKHLFQNSTYEIFIGEHDMESNEPPKKQMLQRYEFIEMTPPEDTYTASRSKAKDRVVASITGATMNDVIKNKKPSEKAVREETEDLESEILGAINGSEIATESSVSDEGEGAGSIEAGGGDFGGAGASGEY